MNTAVNVIWNCFEWFSIRLCQIKDPTVHEKIGITHVSAPVWCAALRCAVLHCMAINAFNQYYWCFETKSKVWNAHRNSIYRLQIKTQYLLIRWLGGSPLFFFCVTEKWHIQFNSFRKGVTAWLECTNGTKIIIRFFFGRSTKILQKFEFCLRNNFLSIEFRYRWSLSHTKKSEHNFAYARLAWFMHLKWILFHIFPYLYY